MRSYHEQILPQKNSLQWRAAMNGLATLVSSRPRFMLGRDVKNLSPSHLSPPYRLTAGELAVNVGAAARLAGLRHLIFKHKEGTRWLI
ncbi:hypothetical protein [Candidatus Electronema sp. JM]|uniref:hypothetical protein n=1 Tax=Candidatus Electronema sp. JM TaxID=3401571 RepID=UPI003AA94E3C